MTPDVDSILKVSRSTIVPEPQAYAFVESIGSPRLFVERITESIEVQTRTLLVSTTSTFRVLPSLYPDGSCVVSLDRILRGQLIDGLRLQSSGSERLSSFSRNYAAGYILASITVFLKSLGRNTLTAFRTVQVGDPRCEDDDANPPKVSLQNALIHIIASGDPISAKRTQEITDAIMILPVKTSRQIGLLDVATAIRELSTHYLILASINHSGIGTNAVQIRAQVVKRTIPRRHYDTLSKTDSSRIERWIDAVKNSTRRIIGVRPALVYYPLANSRLTESYHIEIKGPAGTYLGRQRAVMTPSNKEKNLNQIRCAMQPRYGQRHSHFYVHGGADLRSVYFENHFFERVPGSVGRATMTSLAAMVLIVLCAFAKLGIGYIAGTDLLAVLLAVPAVAGAWAGLSGDDNITGESLVARVSQLQTFVTSLLTAWLFAVLPPVHSSEHGFSLGTIADTSWGWTWISVVLLQITAFASISLCWVFRGLVQESFIRRER